MAKKTGVIRSRFNSLVRSVKSALLIRKASNISIEIGACSVFGGQWWCASYYDKTNANRDAGLNGIDKLDALENAFKRCLKKRSNDKMSGGALNSN